MKRLLHKKVLVTGGSSGIGQAIAIALAREGAHVVLSYKNNKAGVLQTLQQIESEGNQALSLATNLENPTAAYELAANAIQQLGGIDILVNNTGILTRHTDFLDIDLASFEKIQAVNLRSPFILMQEIAKQMKQQNTGGNIINVSSISAEIPTPGLTHYECSKASLNALTRGASLDLAPFNIKVNGIAPGLIPTNINKSQREANTNQWQNRTQKIPLGPGKPEDIAALVVFLCLKEAEWITGSIITVDGGSSIANSALAFVSNTKVTNCATTG